MGKKDFTLQWETYGVLGLSDILPEVYYHWSKWEVEREAAQPIRFSNTTKTQHWQDSLKQPKQKQQRITCVKMKGHSDTQHSIEPLGYQPPWSFLFLLLHFSPCYCLLTNPAVSASILLFPDSTWFCRYTKAFACIFRTKNVKTHLSLEAPLATTVSRWIWLPSGQQKSFQMLQDRLYGDRLEIVFFRTSCSVWTTYVHEKAAKEIFTEADMASAWMRI